MISILAGGLRWNVATFCPLTNDTSPFSQFGIFSYISFYFFFGYICIYIYIFFFANHGEKCVPQLADNSDWRRKWQPLQFITDLADNATTVKARTRVIRLVLKLKRKLQSTLSLDLCLCLSMLMWTQLFASWPAAQQIQK